MKNIFLALLLGATGGFVLNKVLIQFQYKRLINLVLSDIDDALSEVETFEKEIFDKQKEGESMYYYAKGQYDTVKDIRALLNPKEN